MEVRPLKYLRGFTDNQAQPGSYAAMGLGKHERKQEGLQGGVVGFVSLCGFVLPEGISLVGGQGGYWPPWILKDTVSEEPASSPADEDFGVLSCISPPKA